MSELFRIEADNQLKLITEGLLALERNPRAKDPLEIIMRAAHSLKGAARVVDFGAAVRIAHAMEDYFVSAQKGEVVLEEKQIDHLLKGVDLLGRIAKTPDPQLNQWEEERRPEVDSFVESLIRLLRGGEEEAVQPESPSVVEVPMRSSLEAASPRERVLRVTADSLNRLLGLAGESLVESRRLDPFAESLLHLNRQQGELLRKFEGLREVLNERAQDAPTQACLVDFQDKIVECRKVLAERVREMEGFDQRATNLAHRLYEEALACRMRPFADGVQGFPRMMRDLARSLGKEINFEIVGETASVDREILERLEAPMTHLLRNALDHGIESPEQRLAYAKPAEGLIRLDARHHAGMLQVTVSDDGCGLDPEVLRRAVVEKKLVNPEVASKLNEAELLEFLFLPGFSLKSTVSEISGRGVGLDVVQNMVKQVRGSVRIFSEPSKGTRFRLQVPLTLSVVRTLLVEIGGAPYAFPLAYLARTLKLAREKIEVVENRQHFNFDGHQIGLVTAHQIFECTAGGLSPNEWPVIVLENNGSLYGVVVDRFIGERELVVHPLDSRLGKVKNISAGALMEDGEAVLIVDVEDFVHSIAILVSTHALSKISDQGSISSPGLKKRILVVDDSLTVRELERKLLGHRGYEVETALDGMEGWNAVRTGHFDLVISDVDMPRMDGIELVTLIKKDPTLKAMPVMIVSYKDRTDDRQRGLDAGADYYLTKGSFHDESLLRAVRDLIGEPA